MKIQAEKDLKKKKRINNIYNEWTDGQENWIDNDQHKLSNFTLEEKIKKAKLLAKWAMECPDAYSVEDYCLYVARMNDSTLYGWAEDIEEVRYWVDIAKKAIGSRREKQAIGADRNVKLDAPHVMKFLHHWLPRYHKHEVFMAELSKKSEDKPQNITVVLDKYPESDIVKDKDNG